MNAIAATWDTIVAGLNGLGTAQLAVVIVAIAAAVWTLGRVLALVEVLVRGHAPAEVDGEVIEVLGRIEDALGERGHLAGCVGDVCTATDALGTAYDARGDAADRHHERVEELLAQLVAATRATTLAVIALDDDEPIGDAVELQLAAYVHAPKGYGEAFGTGRVPTWSTAPGGTDEHDQRPGTELHKHAESLWPTAPADDPAERDDVVVIVTGVHDGRVELAKRQGVNLPEGDDR